LIASLSDMGSKLQNASIYNCNITGDFYFPSKQTYAASQRWTFGGFYGYTATAVGRENEPNAPSP